SREVWGVFFHRDSLSEIRGLPSSAMFGFRPPFFRLRRNTPRQKPQAGYSPLSSLRTRAEDPPFRLRGFFLGLRGFFLGLRVHSPSGLSTAICRSLFSRWSRSKFFLMVSYSGPAPPPQSETPVVTVWKISAT